MFYDLNLIWPIPFSVVKPPVGGGKKGKENKNSNSTSNKEDVKDLLIGRQRDDLRSLVMDAADLGFNTIAYNFIVKSKFDGNHHRNPYASTSQSTDSLEVPFPELDIRNKKGKQSLPSEPLVNQLTRMTLVLDDDSMGKHGHGLTNTNQTALMEYDLLSAQPFNDQSFSTLCLSLTELKPFSIDIISLDFASNSRTPFFMKRSLVNMAIQNGAVFEICYSKAVNGGTNGEDSKARRNIISSARELIRMTNGKGMIISSGAATLMGLRGPYDIINFASIIGLNPIAAKDSISSTCRSLLIRAQTRKTFRGVVGDVQIVLPTAKNAVATQNENLIIKRKDREEDETEEEPKNKLKSKKSKIGK